MTTSILRIAVVFLSLSLLSGCSASPSKKGIACSFSRDTPLEPYKTEGITLSLPHDSKLTAENTIDARYWTWQTNVGQVSVTWVGRIARETRDADHEASCVLDGKGTRFKVYLQPQKVVAVSDALLENGAGLLVEVEATNANPDLPTALAVIESIQVATK